MLNFVSAARGGQIILSESTFEALRLVNSGQATGCAGSKSILLHMGSHVLSGHPSSAVLMPLPMEDKAVSLSSKGWFNRNKQSRANKSLQLGIMDSVNDQEVEVEGSISEVGPGDGVVAVNLYQLIQLRQLCRLSLFPTLPALRTERQLTLSVLDSPIGCVAIAALQAVGLKILQSELSRAAVSRMLAIFNKVRAATHPCLYFISTHS